MSSFPILDLVIGMIFIYFLLSLLCSSAVELWLTIRRTRSRLLEKWLKGIFNLQALDPQGVPMEDEKGRPICVGQAIIDHCMVIALSPRRRSNSYLGDENFATALLDKITITTDTLTTGLDFIPPPETLENCIDEIKKTKVISAELQRTFLQLAYLSKQVTPTGSGLVSTPGNNAAAAPTGNGPVGTLGGNAAAAQLQSKNGINEFREQIKKWFNLNQDRLTGTYKRKALPATIIIAIFLTIGLNVDSIKLGKYFYTNKEAAAKFAELASRGTSTSSTTGKPIILDPELPWGWDKQKEENSDYPIVGWLATILAIILGAPFWFDILNKLVNLRNTGPKPQDTSRIPTTGGPIGIQLIKPNT